MSLDKHAQARSVKGRVCAVCRSSLVDEIDEGFKSGIGAGTIRDWLRSEHQTFTLTLDNLRHHQRTEHHLFRRNDAEIVN